METLGKEQKEQVEYSCVKCNFVCYRKYNWDRHILTPKHLKEIVGNDKKEQKEQTDIKELILEIVKNISKVATISH